MNKYYLDMTAHLDADFECLKQQCNITNLSWLSTSYTVFNGWEICEVNLLDNKTKIKYEVWFKIESILDLGQSAYLDQLPGTKTVTNPPDRARLRIMTAIRQIAYYAEHTWKHDPEQGFAEPGETERIEITDSGQIDNIGKVH